MQCVHPLGQAIARIVEPLVCIVDPPGQIGTQFFDAPTLICQVRVYVVKALVGEFEGGNDLLIFFPDFAQLRRNHFLEYLPDRLCCLQNVPLMIVF